MESLDEILQQVAATEIGFYTDYNFGERSNLDLGLAGSLASQMMPVAGNKAGCVVAIYQRQPNAAPDTQPVVWLDSEGSPNGIFARDLNAFLRIIPFGSGLVYDVLAHCLQSYKQSGFSQTQRFETLAEQARPCSLAACQAYRHWLSQRGLGEEKNPVGAIRDAFLIEPGFQEMLSQSFTQK
jgi:hypothetical protein